MALYRKYRPATFAEVVGQEHVTAPLSTALDTGRISHAYLFSGPRGCGKTSSARILARSLNCVEGPTSTPCGVCPSCVALGPGGSGNLDVIELDAASHGGVDDTRELRDRAFYAPAESRYRVFIVDEAHMVTTAGFNALLKIVEEPPAHLIFIFATTEPDKVLPTIRSRTHHYPFRLLPPATMRGLLGRICDQERVPVEESVYPLVIRAGGGSPRDSLSVLDQLLAGAGEEGVTYARAVSLLGVTDVALIDDAVEALAADDGAALFGTVDSVMEAGHDPRRFAVDLLERFRDLILMRAVPDATERGLVSGPGDVLDRMRDQADRLGPGTLTRYAELLHEGLGEMRGATAPRLLLEVVCARMLLPSVSDTESATLQRLERLERAAASGLPMQAAIASAPTGEVAAASRPAPAEPGRRRGAEALAAAMRQNRGQEQSGDRPPAPVSSPPPQPEPDHALRAGDRPAVTAPQGAPAESGSAAAHGERVGGTAESGSSEPTSRAGTTSGVDDAPNGSVVGEPRTPPDMVAGGGAASDDAVRAGTAAGAVTSDDVAGREVAGGGGAGRAVESEGREAGAVDGGGTVSSQPTGASGGGAQPARQSDPEAGGDRTPGRPRPASGPDVGRVGAGESTRESGPDSGVDRSGAGEPGGESGSAVGRGRAGAGESDQVPGLVVGGNRSGVGEPGGESGSVVGRGRVGAGEPDRVSGPDVGGNRSGAGEGAHGAGPDDGRGRVGAGEQDRVPGPDVGGNRSGVAATGHGAGPNADGDREDAGGPDADAELLRAVEAAWADIRAKVREFGPTVQALLSGASVSRIEDGVIVFAHQHAPLAARLSDARNLDAVRSAVRAVLGRDHAVRWESGAAAATRPAARTQAKGRQGPPSRGSAAGQSDPTASRSSGASPAVSAAPAAAARASAPPRFSRPSQAGKTAARGESARAQERPARGSGVDDDVPPPDFPDLPDDPGPGDYPPPDPVAEREGPLRAPTPEEEQEMLAEAARPVAPGERRDPDEVALELLRTELGATRLDG